ncbi:MAG TPA: WYL domain-containing protein [Thermoflexia bacterium]|nr:WYL domain-containing protein [Thermoflexia bacterium]
MPNKETTRVVMRRCLALLRRLQRGPASKEELIAAVRAQPIPEPYGATSGRALARRFDGDKQRLKDIFGAQWRYQRSTGKYELIDLWESILDLPDADLAALAFLQELFEPRAPNYTAVQHLLSLLLSYLSPERRGELERQRTALAVKWGRRDDDEIASPVADGLQKALIHHRLVEFDYYSPAQPDGEPRRHIVEPWKRYFDSVRGHYYLHGYCRQTTSAAYGPRRQQHYFHYRLGRIRNLKLLPDKLPSSPRQTHRFQLDYQLAPEIARRGEVSRHPGITILAREPQADGGMLVHAKTDDIWWAVRTLLHYGPNCKVLGGYEARYEMRQTVQRLAQLYGE